MPIAYPTKIATCCYCGTRAALRLDQVRHELTCAQCGAPLRNLKMMPSTRPAEPPRPAVTHQPQVRNFPAAARKPRKSSKPKRRKGWFAHRLKDFAEEAFDLVEDIFD